MDVEAAERDDGRTDEDDAQPGEGTELGNGHATGELVVTHRPEEGREPPDPVHRLDHR